MKFEFKSLSDPHESQSTVMMVFGAAGTGKSHLAGTIGPKGLVINTGAGQDTWLSPDFIKSVPADQRPKRIDVFEEFDLNKPDADVAGRAFDRICDLTEYVINSGEFDALAIDDGSFFSRVIKSKALAFNKDTKKSQSLDKSVELGVPLFEIQDYGTEMDILNWYLAHFLPLLKSKDISFLLTAHEGLIYRRPPGAKLSEEPTLTKIYPLFVGKKDPAMTVKYFDLVWHLTNVSNASGQIFRTARTIGNDLYECKTRWGGLFNGVETNPSFTKIRSKIKTHIQSLVIK